MGHQRYLAQLCCWYPAHAGCGVGCGLRYEVGVEGLEAIAPECSATLGSCVMRRPCRFSPMCALGDNQHLGANHSAHR